ncbi:MAG: type II secretion system protein [Steroidobacterales bacterium]
MSNRIERGFTLIELVVVITILGILAAFAVPRFIALEGKAREAAINGIAGSLRSASALSHGMWLASGSPATITMDGLTVNITNGYPALADIDDTLADTNGFTFAATATATTFTKTGATTPATCVAVYTPSAVAGVAPTVTTTVTGC